jgi:t-SNARE complex subunit (syntaxin)
MFLDLAALVHEQGNILNSVEQHVDKADVYVEQAKVNTEIADRHGQNARWKYCILMVILLIVIVAILAPVLSISLPNA